MALKPLKIPFGEMKGLMQAVDDNLLSLSYSPDCQNIDAGNGMLSTRKGSTTSSEMPWSARKIIYVRLGSSEVYSYAAVIGTTDNKWYYEGEVSDWTEGWIEITAMSGVSSADCDALAYTFDGEIYTVVFSRTGVYKLCGNQNAHGYAAITAAALGGTPPAGNTCTLHRERIWVAGKDLYPNTVYYSNAYDPEDWSTAGATGSIEIVTHDSDKIIGIKNMLDDVLIFKGNSVWKITGDIPGEYEVVQVFSSYGAIYRDSIFTDGVNCVFANTQGIYTYNGIECKPLLSKEIQTIYADMRNIECLIYRNKLYIMDLYITAAHTQKHIVYDLTTKTIEVMSFSEKIYDCVSLRYATGETMSWLYDKKAGSISSKWSGLTDGGVSIAAYWLTPESDLGYPHAEKTITDMYFNAWGTDSAGNAGGQVKITAYYKGMNGVQKTKEKIVTLSTTRKQHDVRLGITGRLFKFKFENVNGSAINLSSIYLACELAED